ncbi:MAG: YlxR family protein, partial [Thermaurantiacus sp.]
MRAGPDDASEGRLRSGTRAHAPERRCVLTGAHGPRLQLIRLVAGPDGTVWPDLAGRLPGRGAWVVADGARVAEAVASGRLAKALARAFRSAPPRVPG